MVVQSPRRMSTGDGFPAGIDQARPQAFVESGLEIAYFLQLTHHHRAAQRSIPAGAAAMRDDVLRGQHAATQCLMRALDLGQVQGAGAIADQDRAGHLAFGQRLIAAGCDRARAIRDDAAALKQWLDFRMVLDLLKQLEWLQLAVFVVESDDIADGDTVLVEVIQKQTAIGGIVGRPAESVHDLAGADPARRQLPQFLDADRIGLRIAVRFQIEARHQSLGQMSARTFGQHGDRRANIDALGVTVFVAAVLGDTHVTNAHTDDGAVVVVQGFRRGEARIDFDTERFCLRCQPCAHRTQRDDEVAMVRQLRWRRHLETAGPGQPPHFILGRRHADRRRVFTPARQQFIQRSRFDHGAREDMRTNRR